MRSKLFAVTVLVCGLLLVALPAFSGGVTEAPEEDQERAVAAPLTGPAWAADTSPVTLNAWVVPRYTCALGTIPGDLKELDDQRVDVLIDRRFIVERQ